jgi:predicted RNA-binding protein with PUA-like domain
MMFNAMHYLLKTEPDVYSFQQLQLEQQTVWDGVTNPQAVKNLREMHPGDKLIIYHTGDERRAVGVAQVLSIKHPVALADIKQTALFTASPLLRQGRLSVVPLTDLQYKALLSGEL